MYILQLFFAFWDGLYGADTYPALPITFPFSEEPPDFQTVRREFEYAYVQTNPKVTSASRSFELSHEGVSLAERVTWLAFWNARKGGYERFNFMDPNTGDPVICRFDEGTKTKIVRANGGRYTIGPIRLVEAL